MTDRLSASLPERLRNETRELHTEVERGPLMRDLLRGQLGLGAYCLLLRNLQPIYVALEAALVNHASDTLVAPVFSRALFRSDALRRDLDALHGPAWEQALAMQPACQVYVERLQQVGRTSPVLLVAHAYVRYLGDLSGGQLLKRIVADSLQLAPGVGTAFYDFGDADQTRRLTRAFRDGLGGIAADEAQTAMIVTEAQHAFEMHKSLFQQLASAASVLSGPGALKTP